MTMSILLVSLNPQTPVMPRPRGGLQARVLYADPPPLEIGTKVLDHQRQRRPKENLLNRVEGEKMGFHPRCLYSKYSVFSGEPNNQ